MRVRHQNLVRNGVSRRCNECQRSKVFSVDYASQADVKVFVVDYVKTICAYTDYSLQATKNSGAWFWVDYESRADKDLFCGLRVSGRFEDLLRQCSSQSEWKNRSKMHLMYWCST